jgi:hypothetical protein
MSFRVTPGFKATLDRAAKESGRSLAQEIELRLERSLDEERHLTDVLELVFGRRTAGLMLAIGVLISGLEPAREPGDVGWFSNPDAFRVIVEGINLLLQAIDPHAHPKAWTALRRAIHDGEWPDDAVLHVSVLAQTIADPERDEDLNWSPMLVRAIRGWLGEAVFVRIRDRLGLLEEETHSGPQEE